MYKILILALFFPFFAFSDEFPSLEQVCSGEEEYSVTEKLASFSCSHPLRIIFPALDIPTCKISIHQNQTLLLEEGWTQKQLNFIGYYVSKDREPNNEKIQYTNYINENSIPKPTSSQELQILINNIRSNHGLSHIEDISTAIPECEDLFSNEPETSEPESNPSAPDSVPQTNTSDSEPQTDEPTINEFLGNPLSLICSSSSEGQQNVFARHLKEYSCFGEPENINSDDCKSHFEENQIALLGKGWTQKQLNYFGFHASVNANRSQKVPYTIDINENTEISPNSSKQEILELINKIRENYELTEEGLYEASGCEDLFPDESNTEAGAECVDCPNGRQQNSEITQLQEQIKSLLAQEEEEEEEDDDDDDDEREERRERRERNKKISVDLEDCKDKKGNWSKISTTEVCTLIGQLFQNQSSMQQRLDHYNTQVQGQLWNLVKQQTLNSFENHSSIFSMMSQQNLFPNPYPQQNLQLMNDVIQLQQNPQMIDSSDQNNLLNSKYNQVIERINSIINLNQSGNYHPSNFYRNIRTDIDSLL